MRASRSRIAGRPSAALMVKNAAATRPSRPAAASSASMVFSNVGGSGFAATLATATRCSDMPRSNAGS